MALLWTDGTWTTPVAVSDPELSCPIPGDNTPYILKQDFMVFLASYSSPLALDTAHGTYTDHKLALEDNFRDLGGGVTRFTRTYVKKPASHSEWDTHAYNYIGRVGVITDIGGSVTIITGRERRVLNVTSKVTYDYYRCCASGGDYTSPGAVPVVLATQYCYDGNLGLPVDYTFDYTTPTTAEYASAMADAAANGWSSTVTSQTVSAGTITAATYGGIIVAEDSRLTRWIGNIWRRETRYVLAQ